MTLEQTPRSGGEWNHITECPFCGEPMGEPEKNTGSKFRKHLPCDGVDA